MVFSDQVSIQVAFEYYSVGRIQEYMGEKATRGRIVTEHLFCCSCRGIYLMVTDTYANKNWSPDDRSLCCFTLLLQSLTNE